MEKVSTTAESSLALPATCTAIHIPITTAAAMQRYKLRFCEKQRLETSFPLQKVQGLKPGAFKLWVN
jgi:hypothetical protein